MDTAAYNKLFSFIWNIANDVLVFAFDKGDYKKIILPFMVLRRLDVLLEPTKEAAQKEFERCKERGLADEVFLARKLPKVTGYPFYNLSAFTFEEIRKDRDNYRMRTNMLNYLNGFSPNVQDVIRKFNLHNWVDRLTVKDRLGALLDKFCDANINLSMEAVRNDAGDEIQPGLDNHTMGTLFEQLLRQFNEENNVTEAGEHFTPRDYVQLLAQVALDPIADRLEADTVYSVYDGACGTGGILSIMQEKFAALAAQKGCEIKTFGQELQEETFATCLADFLISGQVKDFKYAASTHQERPYIACGSTLSQDGHSGESFDFCVMNPPFGTPWKIDLETWGVKTKDEITDPRFFAHRANDTDDVISFVPAVSDCQMMFLANSLSRMKDTKLGTRIVEIHNGSSLFTGNAGGGESNLRQFIIENDLLEAIIAMPENMFYNTGIGTYVWIVTNRKEARRKGKVQLIDATQMFTPLKKNLGEKNCEVNEENRAAILKLLMDFEETAQSKIFSNEEFGYWAVTVERPLRVKVKEGAKIPEGTFKKAEEQKKAEAALAAALKSGAARDDWNKFAAAMGLKSAALKKIRPLITERDERAAEVEGEIDSELTDTENIPLMYPGGIDGFMEKEVLPYAPDAKVNAEKTKVGYELSFTKYFYKPVELRGVKEIAAEIQGLEKTAAGLLEDILK